VTRIPPVPLLKEKTTVHYTNYFQQNPITLAGLPSYLTYEKELYVLIRVLETWQYYV
jgi:hypothetical protein